MMSVLAPLSIEKHRIRAKSAESSPDQQAFLADIIPGMLLIDSLSLKIGN